MNIILIINMKKLLGFSFGVILILTTSCSLLLSKMYGINEIDSFDADKHSVFVSKIKERIYCQAIVSDTNQYKKVINLGTDLKQKNNFGQPVQIIYFEKNKMKSFHINCLAKGKLSNIDWNTENRFSFFLPKSAINIETISVNLADYRKIYKEINNNSTKDYTVIVFWTFLLEKVSRSAIETVIGNLEEFGKNNDVNLYLINTDKYFSK